MIAEPVLALAWLVLAHLVADFVFQTGRVVRAKTGASGSAAIGLLVHGAMVALTLVPLGLAFGGGGWIVLVVVSLSHMAIDRSKVVLTRRADAAALAEARRRHETAGTAPDGLGPAWTPLPAALFAIDQLAHVLILAASWLVWLAPASLEPGWLAWVGGWTAGWDPDVLDAVSLRTVVLAALLIVNVRAGALFVAILVGPRLAGSGTAPSTPTGAAAASATPSSGATAAAATRRSGWTVRLGPLVGRVDPDATPAATPASTAEPAHAKPAPPARVGEAIGILERLLIVTFVLVGAEAAIGLVIAAKTLARFRQLDDRDFAEYYLLGTLASVAIAAISAFAAAAVLDSLG